MNPEQGYLANWNNKLAPGFASSSQVWGDGAVYRSLTLSDRIRALLRDGRPVTRADLVGAMIDAGTVDLRGAYVLPWVLKVVGDPADPQDAAAVRLMRRWVADGAHRVDRRRTGCLRPPGRHRALRHLVGPRGHRGLVRSRLRLHAAPGRAPARAR